MGEESNHTMAGSLVLYKSHNTLWSTVLQYILSTVLQYILPISMLKKGILFIFQFVYFAGAPAEGEESGATTAGAGAGTQQEV
jgi:hypothetical protein